MTVYESKKHLKEEIHKRYLLLDGEFDDIPDQFRDVRDQDVDRTPGEILAYQLGWLNLLMSWDRDERLGKTVVTPSPHYKWNQLGALYQSFYDMYSHFSLTELRQEFKKAEEQLQSWIDTLTDEELFTQGTLNWTGENPKWPAIRFIHVNSVAPFKNFRTKIRKWKKNQLG
ncbi:ClbS/DfsB family four-helix bundle protein [Bacillus paralicheniformis]|uniref:ClbS/DfsB family four-helix bundle protein n=1 Tax=Bacillus paralicheniformis TaxID=1648923 RepID=UPI001898C658|nr:ClbS/DfsB family four-helix bundle protein [Bacillus paralicheniformis]